MTPRRVAGLLTLVTLAALACAVAQTAASARAATARRMLAQGDPRAARAAAESSLALYPWSSTALHTANVARKRTGAWPALAEACAEAAAWNPERAAVARLEAEALAVLGQPQAAGEAAWRALAVEPIPQRSASQIWRLAMLDDRNSARQRAAAWFAIQLLESDAETPQALKQVTRVEAERILGIP